MLTIFGLRLREQQILLLYLLLATIFLTGLASWALSRAYAVQVINAQAQFKKIRQQQRLFEQQQRHLALLDSTHRAIVAYQPTANKEFAKATIQRQISEVRQIDLSRAAPLPVGSTPPPAAMDSLGFFRAFGQAADFYQMMYDDKIRLANERGNLEQRQEDLKQCLTGLQPPPAANRGGQPVPLAVSPSQP